MRRALLAFAILAAGCASERPSAEPLLVREDPVAPGTSREDLLFAWGVPTTAIEGGRILCWRLRGGRAAFPEHVPNHPEYAAWRAGDRSLVVVFGPDGRALRSSEVQVDRLR
ncbi:MAG: hypothetical protein HMLKMBBP_02179 [Planctomycetes bacterium]|nr:hypothetical protein [Planctomycetota bacterium]